jgi:superfamily II DNA or RNA helicase
LNILEKRSHDFDEEKEKLENFLHNIQTVMVDEVHMATANILKKLLTHELANAPIRWGLTGTIPKEDFEYQALRASIGDVINQVSAYDLQQKGVLSNCHIEIIQTAEWKEFRKYPEELKFLVGDSDRITYISQMIRQIRESGNTLVLCSRIETGRMMIESIPEAVFISGEVKTKDRKEEYDEIKTSDNKIIVATYGVAAVGINIPRIFNLVLLEPGKSFVRVIQSIGRGIRRAEDKDFVTVYDICASTKYSKKHLTERKRYYKDSKYPFTVTKVKRPII